MKTFEKNKQAFLNPQPGDYWNEMMIPYFVIVQKIGTLFVVLNKVIRTTNGWYFDYNNPSVYSKYDIENDVKYSSAKGKEIDSSLPTFVADVRRSENIDTVVKQYLEIPRDKAFVRRLNDLVKRKKKQVQVIKKNPNTAFVSNLDSLGFKYVELVYGEYVKDNFLSTELIFVPKIKALKSINGVEFVKFIDGEWSTDKQRMQYVEFKIFLSQTGWLTKAKKVK